MGFLDSNKIQWFRKREHAQECRRFLKPTQEDVCYILGLLDRLKSNDPESGTIPTAVRDLEEVSDKPCKGCLSGCGRKNCGTTCLSENKECSGDTAWSWMIFDLFSVSGSFKRRSWRQLKGIFGITEYVPAAIEAESCQPCKMAFGRDLARRHIREILVFRERDSGGLGNGTMREPEAYFWKTARKIHNWYIG